MAYSESIPQSGHKLSRSQADLLNNFIALKTAFEINHEDFNAAGQGKHIHTTYPVQVAAPTTAADEVAVYCKDNAGGDPALFYRPESDGTEIELTAATKNAKGYTILPSGIMIKWGSGTVGINGSDTESYEATDAFTTVYNASVTLDGASGMDKALFVTSFTTTQISVYNANGSGGTRTYYYFVIGV